MIEAYGQTETSAGMTMTIPGDFDAGMLTNITVFLQPMTLSRLSIGFPQTLEIMENLENQEKSSMHG